MMYQNGNYIKTLWEELSVGNIVKIYDKEMCPADIVLIYC